MKLGEAAAEFCAAEPERCPSLRRLNLALQRGKVKTLEQLRTLYSERPEDLLSLRGIGPRSLGLIRELLNYCEKTEKDNGNREAEK